LIMVHSSRSKGVIETDVNTSSYWRERFRFARRIL
jgi:cell wall-associated NlpC family hydrolase